MGKFNCCLKIIKTFHCTFLDLWIFLLIKKNDWIWKLDKKLQTVVTR